MINSSAKLAATVAIMLSANPAFMVSHRPRVNRGSVDGLRDEYELIMAKKSRLSKSRRDAVMRTYKRHQAA
jgi:hypothetical protein